MSNTTFKRLIAFAGCLLAFGGALWVIGPWDSSPSVTDSQPGDEAATGETPDERPPQPAQVVPDENIPSGADENEEQPGGDGHEQQPEAPTEPSPVTHTPQTARQLRRTMANARPAFNECYRMLLELEPTLSGDMLLQLTVSHDYDDELRGQIEQISLSSDELQIDDLDCFAEVAAELELASPGPGQFYTLDQVWRMQPEQEPSAPSDQTIP